MELGNEILIRHYDPTHKLRERLVDNATNKLGMVVRLDFWVNHTKVSTGLSIVKEGVENSLTNFPWEMSITYNF